MSATLLAFIGSRFTIYAGSVLFTLGFIGNLVTIYLFRSTRHTPVIFLLIILSIANCISLIVGLLNRTIVAIVGIDPTLISPIWCRLRVYIGQTSVLFCQSCACLASFNSFLVTCRQNRWRRLSSLTICQVSIVIAALVWLIHGLFNPLLTELIIVPGKSPSCSLINSFATNYTAFFLRPILIGLFPICFLSIFGILTYRNLNYLQHKRSFDQQPLCRMLLFQMIAQILGTMPYGSFYAYQSITGLLRTKSTYERAQESLALDFINIIFYTPQASPFYVYYLASKTFRKQTTDLFLRHRTNQIQPMRGIMQQN